MIEAADSEGVALVAEFDVPDGATLTDVKWYVARRGAPERTVAPTVSIRGVAGVGNVASVSPGAYVGNEAIALSYQWFADDSEITAPANTSAPVIVGAAEVSSVLSVSVAGIYEIDNGLVTYQWFSEDA